MLSLTSKRLLGLGFRGTQTPAAAQLLPRLYHERVVDHFNNPRNVGSFDKTDPTVGTGLVGAPACGDVMKLQIKVDDQTGKIVDACFKTFGCGSAIASSSVATEWVKGKQMEEVLTIKNTSPEKNSTSEEAQSISLAGFSVEPSENSIRPALRTDGGGSGSGASSLIDPVNREIAKHLSLPPVKLHCSMLAEDAIKAAVKDYEAKRGKLGANTESAPAEEAANA
ncbi:hypothetical protein C3L33_00691, partial [Rhododendron williamsianum]